MKPKTSLLTNRANQTVRMNIRTRVNNADIRYERRNGRDKIIVPSVTLPDDIIMNGIKYPAAEIEKSFRTLERTIAPLGHPTINGEFVSASDPEGLNIGWVGAHNENVRRENGRVHLDKVIDVQRANESEGGRNVIKAIEKGEPIHTSTGLYCNLGKPDDDTHENVALDMIFDHDAILLGEEGAATPAQGVGIFVNSSGSSEKVAVMNLYLDEEMKEQVQWAAKHLATIVDNVERQPTIAEKMQAILKAIGYTGNTSTTNNRLETEQMADEKQLEAITNQLGEMTTTLNSIGETVGKAVADAMAEQLKPLVDAQNADREQREAQRNAELAGFQDKIVKANIMSEEAAKLLPYEAAKELAANAKEPKADGLNAAFSAANSKDDEFKGYDLNSHLDEGKGK